MKMKQLYWITLSLTAMVIALSGCYPRCECNDHGGCFEGMCECEPGYMGLNCEMVAGTQLAATYDVVSVSRAGDTLFFSTTLAPVSGDVTQFTLSNVHGLGTVQGEFSGTIWEVGFNTLLSFPEQALGATATLLGSGSSNEEGTAFWMDYRIIAVGDTAWWDAAATLQ